MELGQMLWDSPIPGAVCKQRPGFSEIAFPLNPYNQALTGFLLNRKRLAHPANRFSTSFP